ncbi:MAG: hypothetical protein ACO4CU_04030 [Ilumatobacteraceae bacterium]
MDKTRNASLVWGAVVLSAAVAFVPAFALGSSGAGSYQNASVLATVMTTSAALCSLGAAYALWLSWRNGFEENTLVAGAMFAGGMLVLAHGLLTPGAFYGESSMKGFAASAQIGAIVVVPPLAYLLWGRGRVDRGSSWRTVAGGTSLLGVALFALLLVNTDVVTPREPRTTGVVVLIVASIAVQLAAASHFADLAVKFRHSRSLGLALGLVFNSAVPVFFYFGGPGSAAYWWAHGMCVVGVGTAALAIWRRARETKAIGDVFAPMLAEKPMQHLQAYQSERIMKLLRDIDDPNDPRVRQVLRSSRLLAEVASAKDLDPATVLPMLRTLLSGLDQPTPAPG